MNKNLYTNKCFLLRLLTFPVTLCAHSCAMSQTFFFQPPGGLDSPLCLSEKPTSLSWPLTEQCDTEKDFSSVWQARALLSFSFCSTLENLFNVSLLLVIILHSMWERQNLFIPAFLDVCVLITCVLQQY